MAARTSKRNKKAPKSDGVGVLELIVVYSEMLISKFKDKSGPFWIAPKCHPHSACKTTFKNNRINLDCATCSLHLLELAVEVDVDFDIAPCDNHPEHYGQTRVLFDGKRINLICSECKDVIHDLKPG